MSAFAVLTNSHRREVLVGMNARELYHFSRHREDEFAQWDIRQTAMRMIELAKNHAPVSLVLTGGKSDFEELKKKLYS